MSRTILCFGSARRDLNPTVGFDDAADFIELRR